MSKIRFGIHIPSSYDLPFEEISSCARLCEAAGIDSIWVADHMIKGSSGGLYEPLSLLAGLAVHTKRIKLGTAILLAVLRHPVLLADIVGTLQKISRNRLMLGIGVGWDRSEFESLGIEYAERGEITDEELEIVSRLWKGEKVAQEGRHFKLRGTTIGAAPSMAPDIWVGGNSAAAIRRATRYQAWFPTDPTVTEIEKGKTILETLTGGRAPLIAAHIYLILEKSQGEAERSAKFLSEMAGEKIDRVRKWAIVGDSEEVRRRLEEYSEAGTGYFVFSLPRTGNLPKRIETIASVLAASL